MRNLVLIVVFLFGGIVMKADIPKLDIFKINVGDSIYYLVAVTQGSFDSTDLCYEGNRLRESFNFEDIVNNQLKHSTSSLLLYKELHIVNIEKMMDSRNTYEPKKLYILKHPVKFIKSKIANNFTVIEAIHGNTFDYEYTKELSNIDNIWIHDYEIEKIFDLDDPHGMCSYEVFAIKGNLRPNEKWKIRWKLTLALRKSNGEFQKELSKLYKRNIIMIGFCTCC